MPSNTRLHGWIFKLIGSFKKGEGIFKVLKLVFSPSAQDLSAKTN